MPEHVGRGPNTRVLSLDIGNAESQVQVHQLEGFLSFKKLQLLRNATTRCSCCHWLI